MEKAARSVRSNLLVSTHDVSTQPSLVIDKTSIEEKLWMLHIEFAISRTFQLPGKREISRPNPVSREISREKWIPWI